MRYVALLRGINVGGNNKVAMADLKQAFEDAGLERVRTYINSGNVVFSTDEATDGLADRLERAVKKRCGVHADIQLRTLEQMRALIGAIPDAWVNDSTMKCDVVFLQPELSAETVLAELGPRPGIEDAIGLADAVIWRIDRKDATRNRLTRIVGTPLYSRVTVRNCNTARKLLELLED